jgi:hypothetical protein
MFNVYFLEREAQTRMREYHQRAEQDRLAILACRGHRHAERRSRGGPWAALLRLPVLRRLCAGLGGPSRGPSGNPPAVVVLAGRAAARFGWGPATVHRAR